MSVELQVYMYDNGSSDNSRDILKKFELSEFVHVRDWDHIGAQTEALNDCLSRFRHTARSIMDRHQWCMQVKKGRRHCS